MLIKDEDNINSSIKFSNKKFLKFVKNFLKNKYKKIIFIGLLSLPLTVGSIEISKKFIYLYLPDAIKTNLYILSSSISFNEIASRKALTSIHKWPRNYIRGLSQPIQVLNLNINQKNLDKLSANAKGNKVEV